MVIKGGIQNDIYHCTDKLEGLQSAFSKPKRLLEIWMSYTLASASLSNKNKFYGIKKKEGIETYNRCLGILSWLPLVCLMSADTYELQKL